MSGGRTAAYPAPYCQHDVHSLGAVLSCYVTPRWGWEGKVCDALITVCGMDPVTIAVTRVRPATEQLPLPRYMTPGAAGMDLMADVTEPVELAPGARALIPTGIALEIPAGFEAQIRPRSGLALRHGVTLLNSPGTIDADYRGEIMVLMINLGDRPYTVRRAERIAQMIVAPVARAELREVETLAPTSRGPGGFGHTDEE